MILSGGRQTWQMAGFSFPILQNLLDFLSVPSQVTLAFWELFLF